MPFTDTETAPAHPVKMPKNRYTHGIYFANTAADSRTLWYTNKTKVQISLSYHSSMETWFKKKRDWFQWSMALLFRGVGKG